MPEWQSRVVFTIDRAFTYTMTELLFGGDGSEPPFEEKRKFSQIERSVAKAVLNVAARALQSSMAPISTLTLSFERVETNMETVSIDSRDSKAVVAKFDLKAAGRAGKLQLIIPEAAVRSRGSVNAATADGDPAQVGWARQMQQEIKSTTVTLMAILEERRRNARGCGGLQGRAGHPARRAHRRAVQARMQWPRALPVRGRAARGRLYAACGRDPGTPGSDRTMMMSHVVDGVLLLALLLTSLRVGAMYRELKRLRGYQKSSMSRCSTRRAAPLPASPTRCAISGTKGGTCSCAGGAG